MPTNITKKQARLCYAESQNGMVSTASHPASLAGASMLEQGGNAVDAAVAAAFCLGVTEPQASGIGGQSMVLLKMAGMDTAIAIDGSSRSPFAINPLKVPSRKIKLGIKATTVPSTVATLGYLLDNYGTMSIGQVLKPAIEAASSGFALSALQHRLLTKELRYIQADVTASQVFTINGRALRAGELVFQPQLADTLTQLAAKGWQEFYTGKIGERIVEDMRKREGYISEIDMQQIPHPIERPVLSASYRNLKLETFPPPGAGRALVQILNILENFSQKELDLNNTDAVLTFALAFRAALRDRERMPIDPARYLQSTNQLMVDKEYASEIANRIKQVESRLPVSQAFVAPPTSGETTHLSVADKAGNVVGITQSIELVFGSKTTADGLGFFYNNYMSAYNYDDMTHPHYFLPGTAPWSSVAPTLIYEDQKPRMIIGSPGSERIATSLVQVISRVFDSGMDLLSAIAAPRLHSSSTRKLQIEKARFPEKVMTELENVGFEIIKRGAFSFYLGCVQAISLPKDVNDKFIGVADPRRDGSAIGHNQ